MPWQEVSIMAWRQEFVALATQEGANRRALWRHFGISPTMGYRWLRRYQAHGPAGLQERSRRSHRSPQRTATAIAQQVLQFRDAHPAWGGRKLRRLLQQQRVTPLPSASTITAILRRHDRRALSSVEPPRRPFVLLSQSGGRCQRAPADGTDTVDPDFRPRRVTPHHLDRQWPPLGCGHYAPAAYRTDRLAVALGGGERVIHGRPYHPQTRGKAERFHRTLQAEVCATGPSPIWPPVKPTLPTGARSTTATGPTKRSATGLRSAAICPVRGPFGAIPWRCSRRWSPTT